MSSRHILSELLRSLRFDCERNSSRILQTTVLHFDFTTWKVSLDNDKRPYKSGRMTKDAAHRTCQTIEFKALGLAVASFHAGGLLTLIFTVPITTDNTRLNNASTSSSIGMTLKTVV